MKFSKSQVQLLKNRCIKEDRTKGPSRRLTRMDLHALHAQTPTEPPTIDLWPVLLLIVAVAIAYFIVSHIKEI